MDQQRGWDNWGQWREPGFRLEAIGNAWTWITRELAVWPVAFLLYWLISAAASLPVSLPSIIEQPRMPDHGADVWALMPWNVHSWPVVVLNYAGSIAIGIFLYPLAAAIMFAALRRLRGEPMDVGRVFDLRGKYWTLVATSAMTAGISLAAFAMCVLPALLIAPLFMFVPLIVMDRDLGAWDAVKLSAKTIGEHYWSALGFMIVVGFASILGVFACCVGLIFTIPIQWLAIAIVYNEFFPPTRPEVA
jgi:hypothetical protein